MHSKKTCRTCGTLTDRYQCARCTLARVRVQPEDKR